MTRRDDLNRRIGVLLDVETRCILAGSIAMASVWRKHRLALEDKLGGLE
jgi:hypothetical protein